MIVLAGAVLCLAFTGLGVLSLRAWKSHAARQRELERLARANGFAFSHHDVSGVGSLPLDLLAQGDGSMATNVITGSTSTGRSARVFDFAYWIESDAGDRRWNGQAEGLARAPRSSRRYYRFTCCVIETASAWPHLVIDPERLGRRLLNKLGLPDVDVESEAFNRDYAVSCDDRRFAELLLDPRVVDLVLSTDKKFRFETRGRWLLAATERVPSHLALPMVTLGAEFLHRVPALVWSEYPEIVPEGTVGGLVDPGGGPGVPT